MGNKTADTTEKEVKSANAAEAFLSKLLWRKKNIM